ncbi:hypothetical protein KVT40_003466 [Elsinoe batatas]|uniref:H/ACA ribonucleoprotein complex non-core subunit NAF1 n=1 Tax=Elsinoe batatas TaxID=2601811 RepID=A0A8K0L8B0_9PEZI|nr:hypothetical protein KVT40_003466 [Elsinoe batatas]
MPDAVMADDFDEFDEIYAESDALLEASKKANTSNHEQVNSDPPTEIATPAVAAANQKKEIDTASVEENVAHEETSNNVDGKLVTLQANATAAAAVPAAKNASVAPMDRSEVLETLPPKENAQTTTLPDNQTMTNGTAKMPIALQDTPTPSPGDFDMMMKGISGPTVSAKIDGEVSSGNNQSDHDPAVGKQEHGAGSKNTATPDREFLEAGAANKNNPEAEWELDSSDDAMDTSDNSSDSSSDESDEADGEYEKLDPATIAKMLMAGEHENDEDGQNNAGGGNKSGLMTKNEKADEIIAKPDINLTPDMRIVPLGLVELSVDNIAVIKAFTSGEFRVVESGSALCLEDRTIIGAVMEAIGRVTDPRYTVAFTNRQEMEEMGIKKDTKIFYVEKHSTFVFTEPLRGLKGTDASNIHDEELPEDEQEFSDDEKESAWKKYKKINHKQATRRDFLEHYMPARDDGDGDERRSYGHAGRNYDGNAETDIKPERYLLKYEDDSEGDEMYTPLARPDNYSGAPGGRGGSDSGRGGRGRGRGRGAHGRDSGGRGGRGRGGSHNSSNNRGGGYNSSNNARGGPSNAGPPAQSYAGHPAVIPPPPLGYRVDPEALKYLPPPPPGWPHAYQQTPSPSAYQQQAPAYSAPGYAQHHTGSAPATPYANAWAGAQQQPQAQQYQGQQFAGQHQQDPYSQGQYYQGQQQGQQFAAQGQHGHHPYGQFPQGQAQAGHDQSAALQAFLQHYGYGHQQNGT